MNTEKKELIQMLGKTVIIEEISKRNITKEVKLGKLKIDNEEIKTYIIDKATTRKDEKFKGKVIGIIEMENEEEKRIIVAKKESKSSYAEIKGYFKHIEEMKEAKFKCLFEKSAGIITYKKINNEPHYLIIYSKKNFPGFPKGHVEYGETEREAAQREVLEEVGIQVEIKNTFRESISYIVSDTPIQKEAVYFLAEIPEDEKINIDSNEINDFEILTFEKAKNILKEDLVNILSLAKEYIDKN